MDTKSNQELQEKQQAPKGEIIDYKKKEFETKWYTYQTGFYLIMPGFLVMWFGLIPTVIYATNEITRELYPAFVFMVCVGFVLCVTGIVISVLCYCARKGRVDLYPIRQGFYGCVLCHCCPCTSACRCCWG